MEVLEVELVVGAWPLRGGVSVYEPLTGRSIAAWDLDELQDEPQTLRAYADVLNPARPYRKRASAALALLRDERELLHDALGVPSDDDVTVVPVLSDDVERELSAFAREHKIRLRDLALPSLRSLLNHLTQLPVEAHHRFLADWWRQFEGQQPSPLTLEGVNAKLYAAAYGDEHAKAAWEADQRTSVGAFSLWTALRVHWAWRTEFADCPPPKLEAMSELRRLFR